MRSESEHHKTLDATLKDVMALLDRQALVHQLVARTDTRKHALVQSLVERQHAVELEKKLNGLHPADAAFVLESLRQEQRIAAWRLIRRERRGAVLLELAPPIRTSLVGSLEEPELIALGRQMDAEDFADLVQDLPRERVDAVLAQLSTHERAEVQSVLSFPEDSVGAIMQLDVVTVRADVTLEEAVAIGYCWMGSAICRAWRWMIFTNAIPTFISIGKKSEKFFLESYYQNMCLNYGRIILKPEAKGIISKIQKDFLSFLR